MAARFWDDGAGGFFMSEDDHDGRLMVRPKSPADGAIPSGNSVAVRALAMLASRTGEAKYRQSAQASLAAFSSQIRRSPTAHAYMLLGADELLHGGAGPLEYGASGVAKVRASIDGSSSERARVDVILDLADGWHVNANQPLQEELIATRLESAGDEVILRQVEYPPAEKVTLGFQDEELAVFQGRVPIRAQLVRAATSGPGVATLRLTIQACNDEKCLMPEQLALEVPLPDLGR